MSQEIITVEYNDHEIKHLFVDNRTSIIRLDGYDYDYDPIKDLYIHGDYIIKMCKGYVRINDTICDIINTWGCHFTQNLCGANSSGDTIMLNITKPIALCHRLTKVVINSEYFDIKKILFMRCRFEPDVMYLRGRDNNCDVEFSVKLYKSWECDYYTTLYVDGEPYICQ